jgi:hypothetical protein
MESESYIGLIIMGSLMAAMVIILVMDEFKKK